MFNLKNLEVVAAATGNNGGNGFNLSNVTRDAKQPKLPLGVHLIKFNSIEFVVADNKVTSITLDMDLKVGADLEAESVNYVWTQGPINGNKINLAQLHTNYIAEQLGLISKNDTLVGVGGVDFNGKMYTEYTADFMSQWESIKLDMTQSTGIVPSNSEIMGELSGFVPQQDKYVEPGYALINVVDNTTGSGLKFRSYQAVSFKEMDCRTALELDTPMALMQDVIKKNWK